MDLSVRRQVHHGLKSGPRNEIEADELQYPIPCVCCNMISQDKNFAIEEIFEVGMVFFEGGKMVQEHHFAACPYADNNVVQRYSVMPDAGRSFRREAFLNKKQWLTMICSLMQIGGFVLLVFFSRGAHENHYWPPWLRLAVSAAGLAAVVKWFVVEREERQFGKPGLVPPVSIITSLAAIIGMLMIAAMIGANR